MDILFPIVYLNTHITCDDVFVWIKFRFIMFECFFDKSFDKCGFRNVLNKANYNCCLEFNIFIEASTTLTILQTLDNKVKNLRIQKYCF